MIHAIKGTFRDLGERDTLWNAGPALAWQVGGEEGFLGGPVAMLKVARGQHVGRGEADHLPGRVESPRRRL